MKRMTLWMGILILCLTLVGVTQAATFYVDVQEGNDGYNGLFETDQNDGINGPKYSINSAISAASPGDDIYIAFANGNRYPDVDVPPNRADLRFHVTNPSLGIPLIRSWLFRANAVMVDEFKIEQFLDLRNGTVSGGSNLWMVSDALVRRDNGILDSQLQYLGPTDFEYYGGNLVVAGFELPPSSDQTSLRDLSTISTTPLRLEKDQHMVGVLSTTSTLDMFGKMLTIDGMNNHTIGGDVFSSATAAGTFSFLLTGDVDVTGDFDLPDVVTNASSSPMKSLDLLTNTSIGHVTNESDWAQVNIPNAGGTSELVGGLANNAAGEILVGDSLAVDLNVGPVVSRGTDGLISFLNSADTYLGSVDITAGTMMFNSAAGDVWVQGNSRFIQGTFTMAGNRNLHIGGTTTEFSSESTRTNFMSNPNVTMVIEPWTGVTKQTLVGNKTETIWPGPFRTRNNQSDPGVYFEQGVFRVLKNVVFEDGSNGDVKLDNCTLFVGGETAPYTGNGIFTNRSGYVTTNGGRVSMNGLGSQHVRGAGMFGRFEVNNADTVHVTGAVDITCTQEFYLVKGIVNNDGDGSDPVVNNIKFNGSPYPTIVRVDGKLLEEPLFVSMVNVVYFGGIKWAGEEIPRDGSTVTGNPQKLNNLFVQTTTGCGPDNPSKGGVILARWTTVHGELKINKDQVLLLKGNTRLTLLGPTVTLEGMLISENDGFNSRLVLGNPNGTILQAGQNSTYPYLPSIEVAAGSNGNKIIGFKGLISPDLSGLTGSDLICDLHNRDLQGELGNLTYQANGTGQTSSLDVQFASIDDGYFHVKDVTTAKGGTLTLAADLLQLGNLQHFANATIVIGQYHYTVGGTNHMIQGLATIMNDEGRFIVTNAMMMPVTTTDAAPAPIVAVIIDLVKVASTDPQIDANFEVALQSANDILWLRNTDTVNDVNLSLNKKVYFSQGTVWIDEATQTPNFTLPDPVIDLYVSGPELWLTGNASVAGDGVLWLNPQGDANALAAHITGDHSINNLQVDGDVNMIAEGTSIIVENQFIHHDGVINLGVVDLVINKTATYQRIAGNYDATTGWLWLKTNQRPNGFDVGSSAFNIPNFRIHDIGSNLTVQGDAIYTVTKRLDMYPGDGYLFTHDRNMQVSSGVTVKYHSGNFDKSPVYLGTIRLFTTNRSILGFPATYSRNLPIEVWPDNADLVTTFGVLTASNDFDQPLPLPGPAAPIPGPNALHNVSIVLPINHTVNDSLILRNGKLVVAANQTLTFADGLVIVRVDGGIALQTDAKIDKDGTNYHMIYENNGNWDIFASFPQPPMAPDPRGNVANPPSAANAPNNVPYVVSGHELPSEVATLEFTRHRNNVNLFTVFTQPVTIYGNTTLKIRNNLSVQANATMTVLSDVYFENESAVFPAATDPVCEFWSPLVFAGPDNQMVYVPKNGIDIRPPVAGGVIPPPPGPARIKIAKDLPSNTVKVTGGDLVVDWIEFCNGLLDTDDDNSVQIPAPAPGMGQGFDRDCMEDGNVSHAIGRITKRFFNAEIDAWSSNERQEFPVGSRDAYRPMAFTFRNEIGQVTIPHNLELTTQHVDTPPRGSQGIPMADNCDVTTNTYAPFYWFVETNGTYTQEPYDVEVAASGLDHDGYDTVDQLRILRRHGNISEIENTWLLQGACTDYDNAQYTEGPTVINEHAKGGLRAEGAIFTVGMPYGDLPVAKHFDDRIVWDGNPYNAMTFYVTHADFWPGNPLQPGDEIAVYDGSHCVGYVKLTQEATPDHYAIIVASKDDDPMDGVTNGYTEGHTIYFRYWDSRTDTEYSVPDNAIEYYKVGVEEREFNVVFEQRSTRVELFKGEPRVGGQEIWLTKGWNIFSLAVDPTPAVTRLFDTATPNIFGQGILNSIEPQLIKVQDEDGNTIEVIFGNWQDNIQDWQATEGYYVKVTEDVKLEVQSNTLVESPTSIALGVGWNIISYPCLESQQDAIDVLQPLIDLGYLDKAMDQYGHALERLAFVTENNGWYNGIGTMKAGQGYYIKLNAPATLDITCPGQDGAAKLIAAKEEAQPQHFARDWGNPYMPMNIYITDVNIGGASLAVGDEVAAYDGARLVGSVVVQQQPSKDKPISLIAGMDDGSGNGFVENSGMTFKVWKSDVNQEVEISANEVRYLNDAGSESGSQAFAPRSTATISINSAAEIAEMPSAFELKQNYPNPFNPSTTVSFAVPNDADVKVQVYDITGKLVTTLVNTKMSAGYHNVEWNGTDSNGLRVATGIYFYKMTAGNFVQTKKMLFAK